MTYYNSLVEVLRLARAVLGFAQRLPRIDAQLRIRARMEQKRTRETIDSKGYNIGDTMPKHDKAADKPVTFESGLAELEKIVQQLESSELPLEKAIELFEKGMELSGSCRKQLADAETKVEILLKKGNKVEPQPFPSASDDDENVPF